jgi:hypothetical protein
MHYLVVFYSNDIAFWHRVGDLSLSGRGLAHSKPPGSSEYMLP